MVDPERKLLDGPGPIEVPIGPLARLNGAIIDNVIQPNIRVFGWVLLADRGLGRLGLSI